MWENNYYFRYVLTIGRPGKDIREVLLLLEKESVRSERDTLSTSPDNVMRSKLANSSRQDEILKYIIQKGSISVDGISLTVQYVDKIQFKISVIPHTRDYTILPMKKVGDVVNLECDIVGKYIERLMNFKSQESKEKITLSYLIENGF